jgi:hypothetical protein
MQHEKLYNLHKTAFLIATVFVSKLDNIMSDQILTARKQYLFLVQDEFAFSYFIVLLPQMFYLKKKTTQGAA